MTNRILYKYINNTAKIYFKKLEKGSINGGFSFCFNFQVQTSFHPDKKHDFIRSVDSGTTAKFGPLGRRDIRALVEHLEDNAFWLHDEWHLEPNGVTIWHQVSLIMQPMVPSAVSINVSGYNIFCRPDEAMLLVMVKTCLHLKNILLFRTWRTSFFS